MFKKFLSVAMVLVMLIGLMPTVSLAAATISEDAFGVNYIFDDCSEYSTAVWRTSGYNLASETVATTDSSSNKAFVLDNLAGSSSNLPNLQLQDSKGYSCSGDVVVEFDMMIDSAASGVGNTGKIFEPFFGDKSSNVSAGARVNLRSNGQFRIYYRDASGTQKYKTLGTANQFGVWHNMRFVFHTDTHTFSFWHNNTPVLADVAHDTDNDLSSCQPAFIGFRVQLTAALKFKIALDNIKVGKYLNFKQLGFTDGTSTIWNTNNGTNKYETQVLNNSSMDSKATVIMAAYDNATNELKKVYTKEITLAANSVTDVAASLAGVDPSCKLKAFFVDDISTVNPFRKSFGDVYAELPGTTEVLAQTTTIDVQSDGYAGITPAYPDGKYKAFTVRYDDGYKYDRTLIEKLNGAGIKGTFYIAAKNINNGSDAITTEELKTLYIDNGHEIANHTYNHLKMDEASSDSAAGILFDPNIKEDILTGKQFLENALGMKVNGFTAPYSTYGASSTGTRSLYTSYLAETGHSYAVLGELRDDTFPPSTFDDSYGMYGVETTISQVRDTDEDTIPDIIQNGGYIDKWLALRPGDMRLFFLWGHAHEFASTSAYYGYDAEEDGTYNNWQLADEICSRLGNRSDTWYATNGEVINYLLAHKAAEIEEGTGSHRIYNPSNTITLCFDLGSQLIEVAPKETVIINVK